MTTPTLTAILAKLKAEPEWFEQPYTGFAATYGTSDINKMIRQHNQTRARLLAVVEALEDTVTTTEEWGVVEYFRQEWLGEITAKLAAALEGEKA